jgi:helix-turn-helix protein
MSETISLEPLLTTEEAAAILGVSPSWMAKARMSEEGPEYIQIGRAIRYARMALTKFTAERTRKQKTHKKKRGATD